MRLLTNNLFKIVIPKEQIKEDYSQFIEKGIDGIEDKQEVLKVKQLANPAEILLVADAMLGQTSCEVAKAFNDYLSITGIALTRIDGTGRCGAALSMKSVSGADIKFMGTGEKLEDFMARINRRVMR